MDIENDYQCSMRIIFLHALFVLAAISILSDQLPAQTIPHAKLSGRVLDDSTGAPLANVNVFIANTMLGAATDQNGFYSITHVPLGTHELVVSMIGYEVQALRIRLTEPAEKGFDFRLKPKALPGPEIEVFASEPVQWKKNLKKFQELFLGTSDNASECKILNPEALDFSIAEKTHAFTATASQPLRIENKALGYRLHFILETFSLHEDELRYIGKVKFEPLSPANPKEMKKWEKNRFETYQGSLQHFLAALTARHLAKEGFLVHRTPTLPQEKQTPHLLEVREDDLISTGELPFERKFHFPDYLRISYTRVREEEKFGDFRPGAAPSLLRPISPRQLRQVATSEGEISWIALTHSAVTIDMQGHLYDPLAITTYGEWAGERVADLLPWEYQPADSASPKKITAGVEHDFYAQGVQHRNAGHWTKALDAWLAAKQALTVANKSDPRIGIAFIELVTQKKATEYYDTASAMYFGGLSNNNVKEYRETLQKELERTAPLLDEKQYSDWRTALHKGDLSLYVKIKQFWIAKDPTPTTEVNERLLEHWERIAHARRNFTRASNTVYGTDDRGLIYVKYGEPDRKKAGTLGLNQAELSRWVFNENAGERDSRIENAVNEFNSHPEYEIWIYSSLHPEEPIIYIFGRAEGVGSFGLRNSVEEFIPDRAFKRRSTRFTGNFLPGSILQMMFYADLMSFDTFFERRYRELESIWSQAESYAGSGSPNHNTLRGIRAAYQSLDVENLTQRNAPSDKSDFGTNLLPIELVSKHARFLDAHDQPKLAVMAFSYPKRLAKVSGKDLPQSACQLLHTLMVYDQKWNEIGRFTDTPATTYDNASFFMMAQKETNAHYVLAAEVFESDKPVFSQPIAISKATIEPGTPLSSDPARLEVSDVVIGVAMPAGIDRSRFPFHLIPSDKIWRPDTLKVYLEIYHLRLDPQGMAHFTLNFQVTRLEKKGNKFKRKEMISLTSNLDAPARATKENFDIDISNLKPGNYELLVEIIDIISSQKKKQREVLFRIME
jgi:GWxTD domain-containing protein